MWRWSVPFPGDTRLPQGCDWAWCRSPGEGQGERALGAGLLAAPATHPLTGKGLARRCAACSAWRLKLWCPAGCEVHDESRGQGTSEREGSLEGPPKPSRTKWKHRGNSWGSAFQPCMDKIILVCVFAEVLPSLSDVDGTG